MSATIVSARPVRARRSSRRSIARVFASPLLVAVLTLAGLLLGLTGDGARDVLSWLMLGAVPGVIAAACLRPKNFPEN